MRQVAESNIVDALAYWGSHEASGRLKDQIQIDRSDKLASLDLVLRYRSPFVSRLIARGPLSTFIVELEKRDIENIVMADGTSIQNWIDNARASDGESLGHFNNLVTGTSEFDGKLVSAARLISKSPLRLSMLVLYDGWHRAAAWAEKCANGDEATIQSFLIVTNQVDPISRI